MRLQDWQTRDRVNKKFFPLLQKIAIDNSFLNEEVHHRVEMRDVVDKVDKATHMSSATRSTRVRLIAPPRPQHQHRPITDHFYLDHRVAQDGYHSLPSNNGVHYHSNHHHQPRIATVRPRMGVPRVQSTRTRGTELLTRAASSSFPFRLVILLCLLAPLIVYLITDIAHHVSQSSGQSASKQPTQASIIRESRAPGGSILYPREVDRQGGVAPNNSTGIESISSSDSTQSSASGSSPTNGGSGGSKASHTSMPIKSTFSSSQDFEQQSSIESKSAVDWNKSSESSSTSQSKLEEVTEASREASLMSDMSQASTINSSIKTTEASTSTTDHHTRSSTSSSTLKGNDAEGDRRSSPSIESSEVQSLSTAYNQSTQSLSHYSHSTSKGRDLTDSTNQEVLPTDSEGREEPITASTSRSTPSGADGDSDQMSSVTDQGDDRSRVTQTVEQDQAYKTSESSPTSITSQSTQVLSDSTSTSKDLKVTDLTGDDQKGVSSTTNQDDMAKVTQAISIDRSHSSDLVDGVTSTNSTITTQHSDTSEPPMVSTSTSDKTKSTKQTTKLNEMTSQETSSPPLLPTSSTEIPTKESTGISLSPDSSSSNKSSTATIADIDEMSLTTIDEHSTRTVDDVDTTSPSIHQSTDDSHHRHVDINSTLETFDSEHSNESTSRQDGEIGKTQSSSTTKTSTSKSLRGTTEPVSTSNASNVESYSQSYTNSSQINDNTTSEQLDAYTTIDSDPSSLFVITTPSAIDHNTDQLETGSTLDDLDDKFNSTTTELTSISTTSASGDYKESETTNIDQVSSRGTGTTTTRGKKELTQTTASDNVSSYHGDALSTNTTKTTGGAGVVEGTKQPIVAPQPPRRYNITRMVSAIDKQLDRIVREYLRRLAINGQVVDKSRIKSFTKSLTDTVMEGKNSNESIRLRQALEQKLTSLFDSYLKQKIDIVLKEVTTLNPNNLSIEEEQITDTVPALPTLTVGEVTEDDNSNDSKTNTSADRSNSGESGSNNHDASNNNNRPIPNSTTNLVADGAAKDQQQPINQTIPVNNSSLAWVDSSSTSQADSLAVDGKATSSAVGSKGKKKHDKKVKVYDDDSDSSSSDSDSSSDED